MNGLFNIENPMNLEIKNVYIKKFTSGGDAGTSVFTQLLLGKCIFATRMILGIVFDGTTIVRQTGKKDPSLQVVSQVILPR